ncbi:glycosyltransferase [Mucilaginibacter lappiensis]|uniref:GT2 family glycosyltransferase n=1 Tax=Mucilaginibacter lappiensis TaxID=354630 RepID=A0A841JBU4_9SPHI|nr:glycosyltransferase [Mucilaginibacter lappiensis]MBB6127046.1 GT2 family glycosyltransferase [Mucilaginibacter lappiensis]
MKFNQDIFAVIVLYKTKLSDSKTFLSLTRSLIVNNSKLDLLVYDNSPEYNVECKFEYPEWNITYMPDINNGGVSKAYNIGTDIATKDKKKWIIIFDQDTTFPENTISVYTQAIIDYPHCKLFSPIMLIANNKIISPCKFKFMRGISLNDIKPGYNTLSNLSVINCGMCIDINSFKKNGGYNERIKLDFSDHDFIKRLKHVVTKEFVVLDLKVYHELSTANKNSFKSDLIRFDYYLSGSRNMSASFIERFLLKINGLFRATKLCFKHKNISFGKYFLNHLFKKAAKGEII